MRIALVAPLYGTVPPTKYGGTERVLGNLIDELVAQYHDVTLYAVAGSLTPACLIPVLPAPLRIQKDDHELDMHIDAQLRRVFADCEKYDIIHIHHNILHIHQTFFETRIPLDERIPPIVWTDHFLLNYPWMPPASVFATLAQAGIRFTGLSDDQYSRAPVSIRHRFSTVYNGILECLLHPTNPAATPSYVAFMGRFNVEKGLHNAIRIAAAAGVHLKIAGPPLATTPWCKDEYKEELQALVSLHKVEYMGEVNDTEKSAFLSGATALLFPIEWDEPFGLVVIEAMACGTPVVAYRRGAVPELVEEGKTGFVVDDQSEAVEKLKEVGRLDRAYIRSAFERRFTAKRMAEGYLRVYEEAINAKSR